MDTHPGASCRHCTHPHHMHVLRPLMRCQGVIINWVDRPSGPPFRVDSPCYCPGYTPKGEQVSTPQAGDQPVKALAGDIDQAAAAVDQAAASHGASLAADTAAVSDLLHAANAAYTTLHSTLHTAYAIYQDKVREAHQEYSRAMAALHGRVTHEAMDAGKPGGA